MRVISWNVQGLSTPATRDHLRDIIRTQNPDIIFLCETKLPIRFLNAKYLQPVRLFGGLVLMWKDGFVCDVVSCENNMIHAAIQSDPSQPEWLLSCMYGYCDYSKKKVQWGFIKDIGLNIAQPWILLEVGLEDLGFIGREHTWSNNNMGSDSKLLHLTQMGSDHCPIMLVTDYFQPKLWKPFKFFKTWLHDRSCAAEVAKAWGKSVQGSPGHKLIKRLQFTRITLSNWNKTHFGDVNQNVDSLQEQLSAIQALPFSQENTRKAVEVGRELDKWHRIQHDFHKQKSIDNFVKYMDYNTQYFHTLTKRKRDRYNIDSLRDANDDDNIILLLPPTNEEILKTVKGMESWSAPGPECFQAGFYKTQWNILGEDVCHMVKNFFSIKFLPKEINKTYISLIPKKNKACAPADFIPIGLCNTSYKIISKILVSRMKPLMERIISPYQAAYVSGRLINDNTMIAHELVHFMKKMEGASGWIALKLDMSKAFDRLEWPFLLKILQSFGFCEEWCQLIHQCISTTSLSVILNDDCLIFTQANLTSVNNLLQVLQDFNSQSGQIINFEKSSIFGIDFKVEPLHPNHFQLAFVSELIIPGTNNWNEPLLHILFTTDIVEKIKNMQLLQNEDDVMKWLPSIDGNFTVKSTYNKLMETRVQQQVSLNTVPKAVLKELWKMKCLTV
ncbi:uncharacterized protein LOC113279533 [Papaver somniferum]|uniref:uncharacterized protein LOC113279533 n=1 Tax=Papaver somniferum TaxID=3469 RepID=UPI000E701807|nr:uncharacterized protein LOC113279533 [Papaver somniferum]